MIEYKLMKIDKLLQSQGFGSRKYCQSLIEQGVVYLNDELCTDLKYQVPKNRLSDLSITIFGQHYQYREKVYIALNKPMGYECSHQTSHHHSVFELLADYLHLRGVQAVGRLDQDTTGLLLFTDDGQFLQKMTHPRHHIGKAYHVQTCHDFDDELLDKLRQGVSLHQEQGIFTASHVQRVANNQLNMTIHQGIYHQVKRMIASAGNRVEQLHRFKIGQLNLDDLDLALGEWCFLTDEQINKVQLDDVH